MYKALFGADGFPTAFFNDGINAYIPDEAVDITERQWREFISNPGQRKWNGTEIVEYTSPVEVVVAQSVSDRQFIQALAEDKYKLITWDEAEAWGSKGELPQLALHGLEQITDPNLKQRARYFLKTAKQFDRNHWATDLLGQLLNWNKEQLDELWNFANTL